MKSGSELATVARAAELADVRRRVSENPLAAAPAGVVHPVWKLWACVQHLFPSPLPLAAVVGVWVREHGLTEDDAERILGKFLQPDRMAEFRFPSDLMTALATAAKESITQRKQEAERAKRDNEAANALPAAAVRRLLAEGIGRAV